MLPKIHAVVGGILADEVDFLNSLGNESANLANDGVQRAAAVASAHLRNHAKAARVVAALRDFDIDRVVRREAKPGSGKIRDIAGLGRHQIEGVGLVLIQNAAENRARFGNLV